MSGLKNKGRAGTHVSVTLKLIGVNDANQLADMLCEAGSLCCLSLLQQGSRPARINRHIEGTDKGTK